MEFPVQFLGDAYGESTGRGRIHKEQKFIIGIPARKWALVIPTSWVLIQGIIDAHLEEEDGTGPY